MSPAIAAAIAVAGCASYGTQPPADVTTYDTRPSYEYQSQRRTQNQLHAYGVVDRIEVINKGAASNAAGTVIGGIVGGLIGHQIGSGSGNTAATILGAAGGAVAGHEIQRRSRGPNETFRVTVRLDSGDFYVVTQDNISDLRPGDRVRLEGNRIYRV
jgi:outer membrane lipoprotein SlyB